MSKTIYTDEDARKAVRIHQQTGSAKRAAEAVGCSTSWIYHAYERLGKSYKPLTVNYKGNSFTLNKNGYRPAFVEGVIREYEGGESTKALGAKYDISPATVYGWVEKAGVARSPEEAQNLRAINATGYSRVYLRRKAVEMYTDTPPMTSPEIAEHFGVSKSTIEKHLRDAGVTRAKSERNIVKYHGSRKAYRRKIRQAARLYHEEDMTCEQVGQEIGVTHETVSRWLRSEHNPYTNVRDRTWWTAA